MLILSKSLKVCVGLLLSILPALGVEENASLQALRALVATENNFSRASVEHRIRDSFLQFFADDSIVFAPEPKNGKNSTRTMKTRVEG
jgi:hypothetical protein